MTATFDWKTFDPSRLIYADQPTPMRSGGKSIRAEYIDPKSGQRCAVRWQTPRLKMPFGISRYPPEGDTSGVPVKYSLAQNLTNEEYLAFLEKLDSCNVEAAQEYQAKWFPGKAPKSGEVLCEAYIPLVKPPKEESTYPPTSRFKLPVDRNGVIVTRFWNNERKAISSSEVPMQCDGVAVVEMGGLWFVGKAWGPQVQANQAKVYETSDRYGEYAVDDGDEAPPMAIDTCPPDLE